MYYYYFILTMFSLCVCACPFSRVRFFVIPWTVTRDAPLSMEFSMQEYWSVLPFPTPGDLPNPGFKPKAHMLPALAGGFLPLVPPATYYTIYPYTLFVLCIVIWTSYSLTPFFPFPDSLPPGN